MPRLRRPQRRPCRPGQGNDGLPGLRTRDFRLTAATRRAHRDLRWGTRSTTARLTGEMTHPPTDHATHDQLLIASLLDRSPGDPDRNRAEALLAACDDCAALHDDLVALSARPERCRPRHDHESSRSLPRTSSGSGQGLAAPDRSLRIVGRHLQPSARDRPHDDRPGGPPRRNDPEPPDPARAARRSRSRRWGRRSARPAGIRNRSARPGRRLLHRLPHPLRRPWSRHRPRRDRPGPAAAAARRCRPGHRRHNRGRVPAASAAAAVAPDSSATELQDGHDAIGAASAPAELPAERSGVIVVAGLLLVVGLGLFALRWTARRV